MLKRILAPIILILSMTLPASAAFAAADDREVPADTVEVHVEPAVHSYLIKVGGVSRGSGWDVAYGNNAFDAVIEAKAAGTPVYFKAKTGFLGNQWTMDIVKTLNAARAKKGTSQVTVTGENPLAVGNIDAKIDPTSTSLGEPVSAPNAAAKAQGLI